VSGQITLVTGATGSLGNNLVKALLDDGDRVAVFKRHAEPLGAIAEVRADIEVRFGDVRDSASVAAAMTGVRRVYHLAGLVSPLDRYEQEMIQVNGLGAHTVALEALRASVERVVHVSSTAAIGYPPDHAVADEGFEGNESVADTGYARSKRLGEQMVLGLAVAGLDVVVVNPSAVIAPGGPNLRHGWAELVDAVARGRVRVYPPGGSAFCAAADLVDGLRAAMRVGRTGHRYILSTCNLSYREFIALISEVAGVAVPSRQVPRHLLGAAGRVGGLVGRIAPPDRVPPIAPETINLMRRYLFYDQSKAVLELGMQQTSLREAIQDTLTWCEGLRVGRGPKRGSHERQAA